MALLQDSPAGCGPASLCNVCEAAGLSVPQEMAWKICGCTGTKGTSERGIIKGITTLGHKAIQVRESDPGVALTMLRGFLMHGVPLVVLADNQSHWIAATGVLGSRTVVIDPADGAVVSYLEPEDFLKRWKAEGEAKPYYAIAFARKPQ